jgi:hypothetical protein
MHEPQALQPPAACGLDHPQRAAADDQSAQRHFGCVLASDGHLAA